MRWIRLIAEVVGLVAIVVLALIVLQPRYRSAPQFSMAVTADYLLVQGTWRIEDDKPAWPFQTTTIQCSRTMRVCQEATAVVSTGDGSDHMLPVSINSFTIEQWDASAVVARGSTGMCVSEVYELNLRTKVVTALVTRKAAAGCDVLAPTREKRMRMADGPRGLQ